MEPFHIPKFPGDQTFYSLEADDSHQSEESLSETKSTPDYNEKIELPLPPGTSGDELFLSIGYKTDTLKASNSSQPISYDTKSKSSLPENVNLLYGPKLPCNFKNILENEKPNQSENDSVFRGEKKSYCFNDNRYSPSKVDSDEENQDIALKPKVLGKEQAKKRLMAFSVTKQSANTIKTQNKTTPSKSKEKSHNPNKSTNFQEQFRATISAIEEEKKKIYKIMPEYLLQEMDEVVKSNIVLFPNLKSSDNKSIDSKRKEKSERHDNKRSKSKERKRGYKRSRSRSRSRKKKLGKRSRSRSIGTNNKTKKRSWSKSREEKPAKIHNVKNFIPSKKVFEDRKTFKNLSAAKECESTISKNEFNESEGQKKDNPSLLFWSHFKPIFNYSKKDHHKMKPLLAKVSSPSCEKPVLFAQKTIKFTRTKPHIIWSENPSFATDYYMSKETLLENCPSDCESVLRFILEGKSSKSTVEESQIERTKSRLWYPCEKYFCLSPCSEDKTEILVQKSPSESQGKESDVRQPSKRKISLVNEDYLSDEDEDEELTVVNLNVQLDLETNKIKVRSKWDSDFEDENNEKIIEKSDKSEEKLINNFNVEAIHTSPKEKLNVFTESPGDKVLNPHPGYLASEYEEFLKMVSFDSKDIQDTQSEKITKFNDVQHEKMKTMEEREENLNFSIDWDKESEEENFKILPEKFEVKKKPFKCEKPKKKKIKTKKLKQKKKKTTKTSKLEKDTSKDSFSDGSSSSESEYDSDSDSDSEESKSWKKKKRNKYNKRKKFGKEKKKFAQYFSDKSESNSDNGKLRKKKTRKRGGSSGNDESPSRLLKEIDLKKQLLLKKVEEIDTAVEKVDLKKGKENEFKKECEKSKGLKEEKKVIKSKSIKKNKLKKTETDSESRSSGESTKTKKEKKKIKKKRSLSESSDSEEKKTSKSKLLKYKKKKKEKKRKGKEYSSSSESDDSVISKKWKKRKKESMDSNKILKYNDSDKEINQKTEEKVFERRRKALKNKGKKTKKDDDDDWETSSSSIESEENCESSWDEEITTKIKVSDTDILKEKNVGIVTIKKEENEKTLACDEKVNLMSETLKNSLSTFSFNENSFCGFGQELSRDFFLTERNFSNSANIGPCENLENAPVDARPFQCIGKGEEKKAVDFELYSPGCSDSELSDTEPKTSKIDSPAKDVYDPLNCDSEGSADNNEVEISTIPLPAVTETSLPDEAKPQSLLLSPVLIINKELQRSLPLSTPPLKYIADEFTLASNDPLSEGSPKMQIMNFKNQQMLKTKAAPVFQDDSDEENKKQEKSKEEKHKITEIELEEKKSKKEVWNENKERKVNKSSCEAKEATKREIRSDSFEIEPLSKSVSDEVVESIQPIPVLLGVSSNRIWSGSLPGYEFPQVSDSLIDQAESFDIYPSEESKYPSENYSHEILRKSSEKSSKRRKSRSRSLSPKKKKRKSKSPIRRRSPKRWSASPKRRDKSPRSPRKRSSPKRKSPSKRRSKSPSRRKKSRRLSSPRRSRSKSPLKRRSPKRWNSPPWRKDSPLRGYSPRRDSHYSNYSDSSYWIPTVGTSEKNEDLEARLPGGRSPPQYDSSISFPRMPAPSINEAQINDAFYENEYANEYGVNSYPEEIGLNNLITIKNHSVEKMESPKRPSLDQRIELELGSPISSSSSLQFPAASQACQSFESADPNHYQTYGCDNSSAAENFYQSQTLPDFNGQYFSEVQQQNYSPYPYPHSHPQPSSVQNAVMQVGNIVEVVPTLQHPLRPPPPPPPPLPQPKTPQIMQIGNVLQVVPSQKIPAPVPVPPPVLDHDSLPSSPVIKTQKATAVVAPSSVVPPPNLESMINPLIKAILSEREKRRKAKEKRRLEREARRKARQLRREAKLMSVSEKLKKSVENEGLVLGQEVEDDELLDAMDMPSPPVPVQIITVSSPSGASPAGKGILITAGFVSKSPSKKKEVKFADGIFPGEGTSSSGEDDIPSSPPKPKLPKEKPFKKKKIKVKKKVKVHVIKQILRQEEDDEDDDNLSPPPPPPGDPPPVFFARFPFAENAQFPVYQTQTITTIQYPAPSI